MGGEVPPRGDGIDSEANVAHTDALILLARRKYPSFATEKDEETRAIPCVGASSDVSESTPLVFTAKPLLRLGSTFVHSTERSRIMQDFDEAKKSMNMDLTLVTEVLHEVISRETFQESARTVIEDALLIHAVPHAISEARQDLERIDKELALARTNCLKYDALPG